MQHTIGDIFVVREWISEFIEDTDYKLKTIDRDIEPGDAFSVDTTTRNIFNYGQINDIIYTDEFINWMKKKGLKIRRLCNDY